ncbi:plant cadmium resistance 2 [Zostera marina]|uniref:Plant cadmium resistance 2 n=1 Tax=Zostera marina TaxID=29655 RepID=A0A0K9PMY3_ZOSMR|nr:plant cadmium resistance 2 [Zostera marina]
MSSWDQLGDLANLAQLTGIDAVRLIGMIVQAANTARMHKKNCKQFAKHLKLIGNLLEQLKISDLNNYPETREPLEMLEDALRRSYILVNSCQGRSYLYLLAMGWNIVHQFKRAQNEIDRYMRIIPLITLVDNHRVREKLEYIESDKCEYTLDEKDKEAQDVILSRNHSTHDTMILKKTLSCSYPNLPFDKALKEENQKLKVELQRSKTRKDDTQSQVIEHLLEVTDIVANSFPDKTSKKAKLDYVKEEQFEPSYVNSRNLSSVSSGKDLISNRGSNRHENWNTDLLDCCSEPCLFMKTLFCPCGTFARISTVVNNKSISTGEACNDLMAYSLILSCCCYTCWVRRKLRIMLNIKGGCCDDFLSHLMCCCCALVQEWREVKIREIDDPEMTKTTAPSVQYMEN